MSDLKKMSDIFLLGFWEESGFERFLLNEDYKRLIIEFIQENFKDVPRTKMKIMIPKIPKTDLIKN